MNYQILPPKVLIIIFLVIVNSTNSFSAIGLVPTAESIQKMSRKEMLKKSDRKLKLKERIAISIFKKRQKKAKRNDPKKKGCVSGIFAIIYGVLGFIPLFGIIFSLISLFVGFKTIKRSEETRNPTLSLILGGIGVSLGFLGLGFQIYFFAILLPA